MGAGFGAGRSQEAAVPPAAFGAGYRALPGSGLLSRRRLSRCLAYVRPSAGFGAGYVAGV
ncbi:hypothetical protein GCM10023224_01970 [Streptomonospora halophila]|uniref:Uncharacterized protein n=1 Tax=Streptomonospora halophila TaxID=427369 RepID=A0ABP9G3I2_9ACTN